MKPPNRLKEIMPKKKEILAYSHRDPDRSYNQALTDTYEALKNQVILKEELPTVEEMADIVWKQHKPLTMGDCRIIATAIHTLLTKGR